MPEVSTELANELNELYNWTHEDGIRSVVDWLLGGNERPDLGE